MVGPRLAVPGQLTSQVKTGIATTGVAPTAGLLNGYDCTAGALAPVLPLAASVPAGTAIGVWKTDTTPNPLAVTCAGADHYDTAGGATVDNLTAVNQKSWFVSDGVSVWTNVGGHKSTSGLDARYVRQAGQRASKLTVVSTRNNTYYLALNGSSSTQTFWSKHKATADITMLELVYGNSSILAGDGPGDLLVNASVLLPSNATPVRGVVAGGGRIATIKPGARARIQVPVTIPKGTYYLIGTYVSGNWPTGLALNAARGVGYDTTGDPSVTTDSGEGIASPSTNDTTATGSKASSFVLAYTPLAILGYTTNVAPVFVGVGDSILNYSNESTDMGWLVRALNNNYPLVKLSMPGESAQQWAMNGTAPSIVDWRQELMVYGTHFVFGHGRNDVTAARTQVQIQADMITEWMQAFYLGGRSWQCTITPKPTSTDQFATLANQTVEATQAVRIAVNAWIRDGAPMLAGVQVAVGSNAGGTVRAGQAGHPLVGYLEVADVVESARDSGKWNVTQVRTTATASMATGATPKVLTDTTASFTQADVGKSVFVTGAGSAGAVLSTTIAYVTNSTTAGLVGSALTTVTNVALQIGAASYDGTHPDGYYHRAIAAAVAAQLTAAAAQFVLAA